MRPEPERRIVVVYSLEPWDDVWRRNQHLVSRLLAADADLAVLFVEPPADPLHAALHGRLPRPGRGRRRVDHPVRGGNGDLEDGDVTRLRTYQPTKWWPRRLDPHGDRRRARAALRTAAHQGPVTAVWVNDISAVHALDLTDAPVLYDLTDDWLAARRSPEENARLTAAEHRLLTESRAVTACSPALVRDKGAVRPDIVLLTNGVDVGSYRGPLERPHDLATGPVALYVGTLHADRLDVDLCARTAQDLVRAGARLVLLGPDALQAEERTRLVRAGAELMGPRPHGQVPAYARSADVLVVPHVVDRFTDSLDPIKLYEYRAARRPVVATPVAGFREAGDPLVRAVPAESFPAVVVHTATSPGTSGEEAEEIPSGLPTWDSQAALMREVLGGLMRPPAARPR